MNSNMRHFKIIKSLIKAGLLSLLVFTSVLRADQNNLHQVEDLDYGVSLFHFYQQNYFSAITDLLVADHYQRINTDNKNPKLLLGGLYLSYHLHNKSSEILQGLLDDEESQISTAIRDRARYLLAKDYYRNKLYTEAKQALLKISDSLNKEDEEERLYLLNTVYLKEKDVEKAKEVLEEFSDESMWKIYAQYNTASFLSQTEEGAEEGHELFDEISSIQTQDPEKQIIQDKASLALGYLSLKNEDSEQALNYFNNIRIDGTETNKALLGLGWARYREKEFAKAIIPWMSLASKTASELTVQEALISIPYAFEKMRIDEQAMLQYELAIHSYKYQLSETLQLHKFIKSPEFIKQLSPGSLGNEFMPVESVIKKINPLMTTYLLSLMTSDDFQEAVDTYQQVKHLKYRLDHWKNGVPALKMILKEKRKTYKNKLAKTMDDSNLDKVATLSRRRDKLEAELRQIENKEASLELVTQDEVEKLKLLKDNSNRLNALRGSGEDIAEQKNKQRLLNGLLMWKIKTEYPARIWAARKELIQLNRAVADMNKSMRSLKSSWTGAPQDFSQFDRRIANKGKKIRDLNAKVEKAVARQEKYLRSMTLQALKLHRNQIKLYHDRALFAKARLYDSLMAVK